jgi:vancomycin permeability regulator SanA
MVEFLPVLRRIVKMIFRILTIVVTLGLLSLLLLRIVTVLPNRSRIYTAVDVPVGRVAIVFGAGLWHDGSPTPILRDRVATAVQLYFSNKVEKLLLSGDNRVVDYNEPAAMRQVALELGMPDEAIVLDYAGRRTYDTCYRAQAIFDLHNAILVTQKFHLPRALFICNAIGLDAVGVPADQQVYRKSSLLYWNLREIIATAGAFWDVYIKHPVPVLGKFEPIFPEDT